MIPRAYITEWRANDLIRPDTPYNPHDAYDLVRKELLEIL